MSRPDWVPPDVDTPFSDWCDARRGPTAATHCQRPAGHDAWHCGQAASGSWWQWPPDQWPPGAHQDSAA